MKIDMHFHSTKSDGTSTPEERILQAKERGIEFMALTDHDVVSRGVKEKAEKQGIQSCESVEISAHNRQHNKSLHITLYAQQIQEDIDIILNNTLHAKQRLIKKQIDFLNTQGFQIQLQAFYQFACDGGRQVHNLNKFDISDYIFSTPINKNRALEISHNPNIGQIDFFNRFFKKGGDKFSEYGVLIPEYEPTLEVCKEMKEKNKAIISIPHPNFTFKGGIEEFQRQLPHYIEVGGINALEINAKATKNWVDAIIGEKNTHGLYLTFGSDCHKIGTPDEKHGDLGDLNPHITPEFMKECFDEYKSFLI